MANQVLTSPPGQRSDIVNKEPQLNLLLPSQVLDESLWHSIRRQIHERRHPEKLPPLQLTSKPVRVRDIWGEYNYKKKGAVSSVFLHLAVIG